MPWGDDATKFLSRVLPWPASPSDAGFGNIHWTNPDKKGGGKPWWNAKAFKSAQEAWSFTLWLNANTDARDVYFCTSLQKQMTTNKQGKPKGLRNLQNTLCSKVLFLDVDVKDPPKGYASVPEAMAAIREFVAKWKLPHPSALVMSGGGLHCYWISNRTYTPAEWQPLAESLRAAAVHSGLRCDGQCTVDITRILRPPETRNYKTDPPKITRLIHLDDNDLDFSAQLAPALALVPALTPSAIVKTDPKVSISQHDTTVMFDPAQFAKRAVPKLYEDVEKGSEGVTVEAPPLDTKAILKGCKFLAQALATGGAGYDQPQWNLTTLAATFLVNGRTVAHAMSDRHAGYSSSDTDDLYDRKETEKKAKDMGWPSCAAIEQAGSKECAGCPLRGTIRSPLNIGIIKSASSPALKTPATAVTVAGHFSKDELRPGYARFDQYLPTGYAFNEQGIVCMMITLKEKTADGVEHNEVLLPMLLDQQMLNPYLQKGPDAMLFEIDGNMGEIRKVYVERGTWASGHDTIAKLTSQGLAFVNETKLKWGDFMNSMARRIELIKRSVSARPLGWIADNAAGCFNQFAYAGKVFDMQGNSQPGGFLDGEMAEQYTPIGTLEPWKKAAQFVIDQKRQEFAAFLASGFAAPLMQFTGQRLGAINMHGPSGSGKSTVLKIAAAIWGDPETSRIQKNGTPNAIGHKMGVLSSLPVYWDEISDTEAQDALIMVLHADGAERLRLISLNKGLQIRPSGTWCTVLAGTSNPSFLDYLALKQPDTASGRYRIVEFQAPPKKSDLDHWETDEHIQHLRFNYGRAGEIYSKFLAEKAGELPALVKARGQAFDKLVDATQQERYWSYYCTCTLLGAEFARDLGLVDFDLEALQEFLVKTFYDMRTKLARDGQEGSGVAVELLTSFLKDQVPFTLITNRIPNGAGRPEPINVIKAPRDDQFKGIYVQWIDRKHDGPALLRISRNRLNAWMAKLERQPSVIYDRIPHRITERVKLGGGTRFVGGPERVLELDVLPGTWLHDMLIYIRGLTAEELAGMNLPPAGGEAGIAAAAAEARRKDAAS